MPKKSIKVPNDAPKKPRKVKEPKQAPAVKTGVNASVYEFIFKRPKKNN